MPSPFVSLALSLSSDAPGHGQSPICWKCKGSKEAPRKKEKGGTKRRRQLPVGACSVCAGRGTLPSKELKPCGPSCPTKIHITPPRKNSPTGKGELGLPSVKCPRALTTPPISNTIEFSNFVGDWRILQSTRGGHRWTTDDICTAAIAVRAAPSFSEFEFHGQAIKEGKKHLDLGCGNGSVLTMVRWFFGNSIYSSDSDVIYPYPNEHVGFEARSEGIENARRTVIYNLGEAEKSVRLERRDFRSVVAEGEGEGEGEGAHPMAGTFDLVTGTPPYFAVEFDQGAERATIQQGGMPSHLSSAPARCEFRGGIEAYCLAAGRMLGEGGKFVVCLNWGNERRVGPAARGAGMGVEEIWRFQGGEGKGVLFGVWVMSKGEGVGEGKGKGEPLQPPIITVRDKLGNVTEDYKQKVLSRFNIG